MRCVLNLSLSISSIHNTPGMNDTDILRMKIVDLEGRQTKIDWGGVHL